jgi:hypothetical protein
MHKLQIFTVPAHVEMMGLIGAGITNGWNDCSSSGKFEEGIRQEIIR